MVEMSSKDFMATSKKNIDEGGSRKDKKAQALFVLQSSYSIKDLFISGRVLYNDPISDYVESIRKKVTESDPQLASETQVFIIKSSVVNAFATNQGYIFITTGLLSQLENEAQLAFVLCHELIHYKKKHVVNSYVEDDRINRSNGNRKSNIDSKYLKKANYSRENESEADADGFDLYVKSGYALDAVDDVFTVLKYAELPFEDIEFSTKNFLETDYLVFPIEYKMEEVSDPYGTDEDEDDRSSTHPNLKKRRKDIEDKIDELPVTEKDKKRSNFILPDQQFLTARKLARFDLCHTDLIDRDYDRALYQAYCLLQDDPNNAYLKKCVLKAIYGLSKYANADRVWEVAYKHSKVQGESQRLNFLISRLEPQEFSVIALNYAWRLKKELKGEDVEVNLIADDLFYDMVKKHFPDKSTFATEARNVTTVADTTGKKMSESSFASSGKKKIEESEDEDEGDKPKSKVAKLKKKKVEENKSYFITYAFVDLLKDPDFVATYTAMAKKVKEKNPPPAEDVASSKRKNKRNRRNQPTYDVDAYDNDEDTKNWADESIREGKYNEADDTYALDVDKVIVVNPFFLKIDERKKTPVQYAGTEEAQKRFNQNIIDISKEVKLDVEILDKYKFTSASVEYYNDMAVLNDWIDERIDHRSLAMLPTDYLRIENICKKYGTEHLGLVGAINFIEKKNGFKTFVYIYISLLPYTWFVTFPYLFKKLNQTYVYTTVFNLKTGQPEMVKIGKTQNPDKNFILKAFLYDYLNQIKRSTSKNK